MRDFRRLEALFASALGLTNRPVAISFVDEIPSGVPKLAGSEPSGCSFWKLAAAGRTFSTVAADHYNCPIGSFTHNLPLPPERAEELDKVLGLMSDIGYVRMEEIPGVFRLDSTPRSVVYAPLGDTPIDPAVVIFSGRPGRIMLLMEAARRAGASSDLPLLPRPTCMAIPAALANGAVASSACIGNRIYTGLGEDELYVAVAGRDLDRIANECETVASANSKLAEYHKDRLQTLRSIAAAT